MLVHLGSSERPGAGLDSVALIAVFFQVLADKGFYALQGSHVRVSVVALLGTVIHERSIQKNRLPYAFLS